MLDEARAKTEDFLDNAKDKAATIGAKVTAPISKVNAYLDDKNESAYTDKVSKIEKALNEYGVKLSDSKKYKKGKNDGRKRILIPAVSVRLAVRKLKKASKEYKKLEAAANKEYSSDRDKSAILERRKNEIVSDVARAINYADDPASSVSFIHNWRSFVKRGRILGKIPRALFLPTPLYYTIKDTIKLKSKAKKEIKNKIGLITNPETGEINEKAMTSIDPKNLVNVIAPEELKYSKEEILKDADEEKIESYMDIEEPSKTKEVEEIKDQQIDVEPIKPIVDDEEKTESYVDTPELSKNENVSVINSVGDLMKDFDRETARSTIEKYVIDEKQDEPKDISVTNSNNEEKPVEDSPAIEPENKQSFIGDEKVLELIKELSNQIGKLNEIITSMKEEIDELRKENIKLKEENDEEYGEDSGKHFYKGKHFIDEEKEEVVNNTIIPTKVVPKKISGADIRGGTTIHHADGTSTVKPIESLPDKSHWRLQNNDYASSGTEYNNAIQKTI